MSPQSQSIVATLKRYVRRISAQQGDVATSAFSLAMLVFLVQKAQAASIANTPLDVAPTDKSGLDQVRQLFGHDAQESVAGINYSAIVDALADIQQVDGESSSAEQISADMAVDAELRADVQALDAELELIGHYVQDAVQYAQAAPASVAAEGTQAGVSQAPIGSTVEPVGSEAVFGSGLAGLSSAFPFLLGGVVLAAAGGGGSTSEPVVKPSGIELTEVTGTVVNGYVAGATVFQDLNGNNKWDEGEPKTETGSDGSFTLKEQLGSTAPIVIVGGTDISTGLTYSNILKAPAGATVITPLTTLVSALMAATGQNEAQAMAAVVKALGLPDGTDVLKFDPIANADSTNPVSVELAVKVKAAGALVGNLMDAGGSALAGASGGDASALSFNIAQTIATKISALTTSQTLDLGNAATLKSILTDSATNANLSAAQSGNFTAIADAAANAIATVNGTIQAAATDSTKTTAEKFNEFSKAQTVAQGTLSDEIESAAAAGTPNTIPDKATIETSVEDVTPINIKPTVAGPLSASATEAGSATILNLLKDAKDLDVGDTAKLKVVGVTYTVGGASPSDSIPAGLTLSDSGTLTVDPSTGAFNYLAVGQTQTITVSYKISDGRGGEVAQTTTLTITGAINDAAVISGETAKTLSETNAVLTTNGKLIATDVDSATTFVAQTDAAGSGGYGKFSIGTDGAWTYTANTAHNEFVKDRDYTDTLTVLTTDGTRQVITVTITGTNDSAVITGDTAKSLSETNAILTTSGKLSATDVDSATTFVAQTDAAGSGGYG